MLNPIDNHGPHGPEGKLPQPASLPTLQPLERGYVVSFFLLSSNTLLHFSELPKVGSLARGTMYIKLINFPSHYLGLVITEEDFRHMLISVKVLPDSMFGNVIIG